MCPDNAFESILADLRTEGFAGCARLKWSCWILDIALDMTWKYEVVVGLAHLQI